MGFRNVPYALGVTDFAIFKGAQHRYREISAVLMEMVSTAKR